jgi:hypothetical protein
MISVKINIKLLKKIKEKCKFKLKNKPDMEAFTYMRDNYK